MFKSDLLFSHFNETQSIETFILSLNENIK